MKLKKRITILSGVLMAAVAFACYTLGVYSEKTGTSVSLAKTAVAAEKKAPPRLSPTEPLPMHNAYFPGTEALGADEMRVTACGTGMPTVRPKQAAACFLVELGNGDKFIFDIGAQSHSRIAALRIPYDYLDKVFIGHLHLDHMADLPSLWVGGLKGNRTYPLRVWGPSGPKPEHGTKYMVEHMLKMYSWEVANLTGKLDDRGRQVIANEFDFKGINQVVYQENGVTVRSIPAIHSQDGAVSFILEWNGLKFAYSSDTSPNKWWTEHTKGADIVVHESSLFFKRNVSEQDHTALQARANCSAARATRPLV